MPRFHFHFTVDGVELPDTTGTELPDLVSVRQAALETLTELARDRLPSNTVNSLVELPIEAGNAQKVAHLSLKVEELPVDWSEPS